MFVSCTNAALMRFATIPKGLTTVHVNLDSLEMEENVKVNVGSKYRGNQLVKSLSKNFDTSA